MASSVVGTTALVSPSVPSHDIFIAYVLKNFEITLTKLRPNTADRTWPLLQTLYTENPQRFLVISSVHQNTAADRLHYSVAVNLNWASWTLHVYGYWKNYFNTTDISIASENGEVFGYVNFVKSE
jgi:hypothetical protein